jgi:hypothetical protein
MMVGCPMRLEVKGDRHHFFFGECSQLSNAPSVTTRPRILERPRILLGEMGLGSDI